MKRFFLIMMVSVGIPAVAQEAKEGETLSEVTVKGARVVQRIDGQIIYPTQQQLETSTNGYSLLSKLTLPHLRIDPVMHTITALSNTGSVQVRINGVIATREDLLALTVNDVRRVEYIDNPGLRYGEDVAYVVNLIVKKSLGGYVLGADLTNTLTAVNGNETLYGKFNHGKSELGATYTLDYYRYTGMEQDEQAAYEIDSGSLSHVHRRILNGSRSRLAHNGQLFYSLTDSDYVFQAKLNASRQLRPSHSHIVWQTDTDIYSEHDFSRMFSPSLDIYYQQTFKRHASLTANIVGTHIRTSSQDENNEGGNYQYATRGRTWAMWGETVYENQLKPFTLSAGLQYGQRYINNVYEGGANAVNHMHSSYAYLFGQLKGNLGKWSYLIGLGASRQRYHQSTVRYYFWLFRPKFSIAYPLAERLKVKYDFEISQHVSQIALVSDVIIKQNGYETLVGNPSIRPVRRTTHSLSLTYSAPRLSAQLHGYYRLNAHCNMEKYIRENGHFFKTQSNADNSCNFFFIQSNNRVDLIPEHLSVNIYGGIYRFFNNGEGYHHTYTAFNGGAGMNAYLGRWTLGAYADNGWNFMEGEHRGHEAPAWYFTAAYRMNHLTVSLYAQHLFSAHPLSAKTEVVSQYVKKDIHVRQADYGNMFTLNFSWTLSSGKKYREVHRTMNHQDTETGILK